MAGALASLGYAYVPGASQAPSDFVLRKADDTAAGFEWKGQQDYDAVGDAVMGWIKEQLVSLCGLEPLTLGSATAYATPGIAEHAGPVLLLVCGSAPGGDAGVWGRSLCINATTHEGAMFDYIERGKAAGWAVVVADVHGDDDGALAHMQKLWETVLSTLPSQQFLVVAHSAGAYLMMSLMMKQPQLVARLAALALTDGAFPQPEGENAAVIMERTRSFNASDKPAGTPLGAPPGGPVVVSAGHTSHPSTTHAATEPLFEFLQRGVNGEAAAANAEVRGRL